MPWCALDVPKAVLCRVDVPRPSIFGFNVCDPFNNSESLEGDVKNTIITFPDL